MIDLANRRNRIARFYSSGQDYWSALEELDDSDDGFRLTPPSHCEQRTVWTVPPERQPEPWVEAVAWAVVLLGVLMSGAIAFGVTTWVLHICGEG